MRPFVVTDETKTMVLDNITYLLNNFIKCSEYENIIFCWVMHTQNIIDDVLVRLNISDCSVKVFSLVSHETALRKRLDKDISEGVRSADVAQRSVDRIAGYYGLDTDKIDVSNISAKQAAYLIKERI